MSKFVFILFVIGTILLFLALVFTVDRWIKKIGEEGEDQNMFN